MPSTSPGTEERKKGKVQELLMKLIEHTGAMNRDLKYGA